MALLETDPIDWALDPSTGELAFPIRYTSGAPGVAQGIRIRLRNIRGEIFNDLRAGVPYFEGNGVTEDDAILGGAPDLPKIEAVLRAVIATSPGVSRIASIVLSFDAVERELSVSFVVELVFGGTLSDTVVISVGGG